MGGARVAVDVMIREVSTRMPPRGQADRDEIVLQVNLAPVDLPHARYILPHQIGQWRDQVDRIVLTVDTRPGGGRYAAGWQEHAPDFKLLLDGVAASEEKVRVVNVDYSLTAVERIANAFLGGTEAPAKDSYGAPFHAYLFGLMAAGSRYVLHADADMLYGGGSQTWLRDAVALMRSRDEVLVAGPFPGPPTADRSIPDHIAAQHAGSQRYGSLPRSEGLSCPALRFSHVSTRSFLIDLDRFHDRVGSLRVEPTPPPRWSDRSPGAAPLEVSLSRALRNHGLVRIDLLGTDPGMWVLHPPFRTKAFVRDLPELIARIERGDVPEGQRGDYDLNDSMVDWSLARRRHRRQRRWARAARVIANVARLPLVVARRSLARDSSPSSSKQD